MEYVACVLIIRMKFYLISHLLDCSQNDSQIVVYLFNWNYFFVATLHAE